MLWCDGVIIEDDVTLILGYNYSRHHVSVFFLIMHLQAKRAMLAEDYKRMHRYKWAAVVMNTVVLTINIALSLYVVMSISIGINARLISKTD